MSAKDEAVARSQSMPAPLGWLRFGIIILENLYCIPAYGFLTWILLGPLRFFQSHVYYFIENHLFNWLLYVVSSWSHGARFQVEEVWTGEPLDDALKNGKILCISNHQATSDVPLMMYAFGQRSAYWRLLWIMDAAFKWTNFGVVSFTHGDYFIRKGDPTARLSQHVSLHMKPSHGAKNFVVLFPEGGFRYKRQAGSDRFALARGLTPLAHVCWPYVGAYNDLAKNVSFTHLIDLTIIYRDENNPPSILDISRASNPEKVIFVYRVMKLKQSRTELSEKLLFDLWSEKDQLVKQYRAQSEKISAGHNSSVDYQELVERTESVLSRRSSPSSGTPSENNSEVESDEKWESLSLPEEDLAGGEERRRKSPEQTALRKSQFLPLNGVSLVAFNWSKLCLIHAFFLSIFYLVTFIVSVPSPLARLIASPAN